MLLVVMLGSLVGCEEVEGCDTAVEPEPEPVAVYQGREGCYGDALHSPLEITYPVLGAELVDIKICELQTDRPSLCEPLEEGPHVSIGVQLVTIDCEEMVKESGGAYWIDHRWHVYEAE